MKRQNWKKHIVQGSKSHRDQDFRHHWFKQEGINIVHFAICIPFHLRPNHRGTSSCIDLRLYPFYYVHRESETENTKTSILYWYITALQEIISRIKDEISRTWILTEHRLCDIFTVSRIRRYHNFDLSKNSIGKWPEVARQRKTARWKLFSWKADSNWDQVSGNTR